MDLTFGNEAPRLDLVDRLRGIYKLPVNDGAGPLNGSDTFTRTFPVTPIQKEAADEIERLRARLAVFNRYIHVNECSDEAGYFAFFTPGGVQDEHEYFDLRINGCESEEDAISGLIGFAVDALAQTHPDVNVPPRRHRIAADEDEDADGDFTVADRMRFD